MGLFWWLQVTFFALCAAQYVPTWDSLDKRPLPPWYDEAKIGIFVHWGVFSVPAWGAGDGAEWYEWAILRTDQLSNPVVWQVREFHQQHFAPNWNISLPCTTQNDCEFLYQDFASQFRAELFDADEWAALFAASGARYVVVTTKHHDGFALWPSAQAWNWNSVDIGPHRDLVGELSKAVKAAGLRMGLYHSLFEWRNTLYLQDKAHGFNTSLYVDEVLQPQLRDIVTTYEPALVWVDGDWEAADSYWKSKEFLTWLYNDSPVRDEVAVNDRWGGGSMCTHGGYYTCADRFNPGHLLPHKWENAFTIDKYGDGSWGYSRHTNISGYMTAQEIVWQVASTVSCGGNALVNIGPTADGRVLPIFQERLLSMGAWLQINGEAIYESQPWRQQNDTSAQDVWYTAAAAASPRSGLVYAISFRTPSDLVLTQPLGSALDLRVLLLADPQGEALPAQFQPDGLHVQVGAKTNLCPLACVFVLQGVR